MNNLDDMRRQSQKFSDDMHQMIADHNAEVVNTKRFYYSEEECKRLCRHAALGNFPSDTFEIWWDSVKKK